MSTPVSATAVLDLVIDRGCDFDLEITLTDAADDPVDLTGASVSAAVAELPGGTTFLDLGAAISDASAGKITLTAARADTAEVTRTTGVWDLLVLDSADKLIRQIAGKVTFSKIISPEPA